MTQARFYTKLVVSELNNNFIFTVLVRVFQRNRTDMMHDERHLFFKIAS